MDIVFEEQLARRLTALREQKQVSAREMSLDIGLSESYVNNIENQKMLPSMRNFFYICDYFGITPREFFDDETPCPQQLHRLMDALKALDAKQLDALVNLAEQMKR
ncbi:helix-turn-helix domain-containing protein [Lawsonibacter hominis]|uniref:helix-turn-helix domain-containing protein n=1 Tax=Lawsonibacter hominis TaxID=2763053 RepID=UPI0035109816